MADRKAFLVRLDPALHEALQRWADAVHPDWMKPGQHDDFRLRLEQRLAAEKDEMVALLNLNPARR